MIKNCCCNSNNKNSLLKVYRLFSNSIDINFCNNENRYYSKSRNIFDDDDEDQAPTIKIDQKQRDLEYRLKNNQPFRGKYHSSVIEDLKKPKRKVVKQLEQVKFSDEDLRIILENEMKGDDGKSSQRNIFVENVDENVEEVSSIKTIELPDKNVIQNDRFSYIDFTDEGFELLLKEMFKNKYTGECDLDEEDLMEIRKMVSSNSLGALNIDATSTSISSPKDNK